MAGEAAVGQDRPDVAIECRRGGFLGARTAVPSVNKAMAQTYTILLAQPTERIAILTSQTETKSTTKAQRTRRMEARSISRTTMNPSCFFFFVPFVPSWLNLSSMR